MSQGALLQLSHKGLQDVYLTSNPEYNFIQQIYRRYDNFAIQEQMLPTEQFGDFGKTFNIPIPNKGDFVYKLYLVIDLPALTPTSGTYASWTNSIGHAIIDYIDLEIGGLAIDRLYGTYLEILNEIEEKRGADDILLGKYTQLSPLFTNATTSSRYYIPLKFWFCKDIGASLPLLGLRYCPVNLKVKLRPFNECIIYDGVTPPNDVSVSNISLLAEYIVMEDIFRMDFITKPQKYLIQTSSLNNRASTTINTTYKSYKSDLSFSDLSAEIIFVLRETASEDNNDWFNFSRRNLTPGTPVLPLIKAAKLVVDGTERIELQDQELLSLLHTKRYHSNPTDKYIYVIPFSNEPEKWIPNGALNFRVVDFSYLYLDLADDYAASNLLVFSRNLGMITIVDNLLKLGFEE